MRPKGVSDAIVSHVLLVEAPEGLVLIDAGYGLLDIADPDARIGPGRHFLNPDLVESECAIRQVEALGFSPKDVREIVLTHFDTDHAGGVSDFPWARVRVHALEAQALREPVSQMERTRYATAQWGRALELVEFQTPKQEDEFLGFDSYDRVKVCGAEIVVIATPGHTRGHCALALEGERGWVLHAGDAFYHHAQLWGEGEIPVTIRGLEKTVAVDRAQVKANHERFATLHQEQGAALTIVNSHDPILFAQAKAR